LISIFRNAESSSVAELEQREIALRECYCLVIHSIAHYAVEVDASLAANFRGHLKAIEEQSRAASSADQLRSAQSSFRDELREYRDQPAVHLQKMRQEVVNATAAMTIFANAISSSGEDHEKHVSSHLHSLESTAQSGNIEDLRGAISTAIVEIQSSVEQIQRSNQLVVSQLQDEIRVLHLQFEQDRTALFTDRSSGSWNRQKIDIHLDNLLRQNQPFCLLMVRIRNLKRLESQHSRTVVEGTLKALISRFAAITGDEAIIGRWTEDQFVAVLDMPSGRAIPLSTGASSKLSGSYAVQENGLSQTVTLQATAGVIDHNSTADPSTFLQKLDQLAVAISRA
jgi:GGDEF domain-containing protein